jgi:pimeloyl-ACP methyl ester carboxylesterase
MTKKTTVLFIPGLGDGKIRGENLAIQLLAPWRLDGEYFPIYWHKKEDFKTRIAELSKRIAELNSEGRRVVLVGYSAGASAAINALSANKEKVQRVILICGKIQNLDKINDQYFKLNPRFELSIELLKKSLPDLDAEQRAKVLSIRPIFDETVPVKDTIIQGAKNKRVFMVGHVPTIAYCLSLTIWRTAYWARKK